MPALDSKLRSTLDTVCQTARDLAVTYADGSSERIHRTPEAWKDNPRETTIALPSAKPVAGVTIDTGIFEDFQPSDNNWKP